MYFVFLDMVRIAGRDLPSNKRLVIALTYIHGIGSYSARSICDKIGINHDIRVKDISSTQERNIIDIIDTFTVEGELKMNVARNKKRLVAIRCLRGLRYVKGLPVRGQNTRNNAKNAKKFNGKNIC